MTGVVVAVLILILLAILISYVPRISETIRVILFITSQRQDPEAKGCDWSDLRICEIRVCRGQEIPNLHQRKSGYCEKGQ
jgi:hypothetical protein